MKIARWINYSNTQNKHTMAKSKKEIKEAADMFGTLTPAERSEELTILGFKEEDITAVEAVLFVPAATIPAVPDAPKAPEAKKKVKAGNSEKSRYKEIQLTRFEGALRDSFTKKELSLEPERADRLNAHSHNSLIRYELID
jgi:hypothetical protein